MRKIVDPADADRAERIGIKAVDEEFSRERHQAWRKYRRHYLALAGTAALILITVGATFAPLFTHFDPNAIDSNWSGTPLAPGTFGHWLGTDNLGRDLWARMLFGGR